MLPEDAVCKDHLVVVIHVSAAEEIVLVFEVDPWKIHPIHLVGMDLGFGQHHVFAEGDMGAGIADLLVAGERRAGAGQEIAEYAFDLPLVIQQCECLRPLLPGVGPDHHSAQAVDGTERQLARVFFPEEAGIPGFHVFCGRHSVGHGEDTLRADAFAIEHVPQPGNQYGGLAAPRHSQQQDRTLCLTDGLLLLPVQPDGVLTFELFIGHGRLPI